MKDRAIAERTDFTGGMNVGTSRAMRKQLCAVLMLVIASMTGPALAGESTPARFKGNPANWISHKDYPKDAFLNGIQGSVGFVLDVGNSGKIEGCRIVESSGSAALDEVTCRVIPQRAKFTPARDERNKRIPGSYQGRVRWVLPSVPPPDYSGYFKGL